MFSKEHSNIGKILFLLRGIHIHPLYLLIPVSLALVSAAFEGVGMGLLIPLLNGFLNKDFTFIKEVPILGDVISLLPASIITDDRMLFGVLLGAFVTVYILKNITRYCSIMSVGYFSERSLHNLRKTLFSRYMKFGKLFFDTTNVGHHNTLLMEFTRLAMVPLLMIDRYMNALFSLTVYLIVMCSISWQLTLFALPLFAVLHFVVKKMIAAIKLHSHAIAERGSELGKKSVEILSTISLVKSHRTEDFEQRAYADISNEKSRLDFKVRMLQALVLPMQEIITLLAVAFIFIGALYYIGRENIGTESALIVYFYIVLNASHKFGALMGFRGTLASATGPLDAVLEIFSDEKKYFVHGGDKEFEGLHEAINFKNLSFSYGDRDVLQDMNFTIPKGVMTAIVGPTGGGKSTIINLLMRYYDCPEGSIFFDETDVREFTLDSYLSSIALVSQETLLLHDSLKNNITYGLNNISDSQVLEACERARLSEFISKLPAGVDTLIGDRGVKLSGGEKQRVSIARALLKGAEIIILDEATSSLDSRTEKLIQEAIDEAVKDRTAIVIAHRLSTISHADRILVVENGEIVEQGKLDDLLAKKGAFFQLWEEQRF